jgi:threonine/homoserine/homoserine lactone efflux protein
MHHLIPLLLFTVSSSLTPGPNNFMIMNSGMNFGLRRSMPHFMGIALGFPVMVLIVALGFGAIFIKYTWLKEALKIVGAIYMLYLAWCIMQSSLADSDSRKTATPFSFMQAVLFQWVNPKAWLMAIGAVSLFTVIDSYYLNAAAISLVFAIVLLPCGAAWLFFGTLLQKILAKEQHRRWFNLLMAVSLVASISLIFIE